MTMRRLHVVCYDIRTAVRRRAALKISRRYATGGQKSVHECWVDRAERAHLLQMLQLAIHERTDRIMMVRLDPHRSTITLGAAHSPVDAECIVLGAA